MEHTFCARGGVLFRQYEFLCILHVDSWACVALRHGSENREHGLELV